MIKRIGLTLPENVSVIESGFSEYMTKDLPRRRELLEAVQSATSPVVIIDLPVYQFMKGAGQGFVLQLQDQMKAKFQKVTTLLLKCNHWGSPIGLEKLVIIGSPWPLATLQNTKATTVADWDPEVLFHGMWHLRFSKLVSGLFPSTLGVVNSATQSFGSPNGYRSERPVVARKSGSTYELQTVTPSQWHALFGVEQQDDPEAFDALMPTSVLTALAAYAAKDGGVTLEA